MKKNIYDFITIVIMTIMLAMFVNAEVAQATTIARDNTNGYEIKVTQTKNRTKVYWCGEKVAWFKFSGKVKIVTRKQLTNKRLLSRKNKVLYIEKVYGTVINENLDGKANGKYICYSRLKGKVHKGDKVVSYFVYNPNTYWIDDIVERFDVPLK